MTQANAFNYNTSDIYSQSILSQDWGYQGETYHDGTNLLFSGLGAKPPFFRDITIYGLSQKQFAQWSLINPLITNWNSDTYDYSEGGGTLKSEMTIEYETVKYYSGLTGAEQPSDSVSGFADPAHYDTVSSSITTTYGRDSAYNFLGGGLVSATQGTVQDLNNTSAGLSGLQNVLGAVQQAGVAYNTLANNAIVSQFAPGLQAALNGTAQDGGLPGSVRQALGSAQGTFFPSAPPPAAGQPTNAGQAVFNTDGTVDASNLNGYPDGAG
jgi:hypothetical protein